MIYCNCRRHVFIVVFLTVVLRWSGNSSGVDEWIWNYKYTLVCFVTIGNVTSREFVLNSEKKKKWLWVSWRLELENEKRWKMEMEIMGFFLTLLTFIFGNQYFPCIHTPLVWNICNRRNRLLLLKSSRQIKIILKLSFWNRHRWIQKLLLTCYDAFTLINGKQWHSSQIRSQSNLRNLYLIEFIHNYISN